MDVVGAALVAEPVDPERPALALELRHQLRRQLAPFQHQHDGRVGLPERPGHPVVESDPSEPAQQTARSHQVERS